MTCLKKFKSPVRVSIVSRKRERRAERETLGTVWRPGGICSEIKEICFDTVFKQVQKQRNHRQLWLDAWNQ